jgi:hypothetical protein
MSKNLLLALGAGGAATAAVVASAATIGTVDSTDLAAGTSVVAACDSDGVAVTYTTAYDAVLGGYKVSTVTLDGVADACIGQEASITLKGAANVSLASIAASVPTYTGTADDNTADFPVSGTVSAALATGVAVVISGETTP